MPKISQIFVKNPIANFFLAVIYFVVTFAFWPLVIGGLIFYSIKDKNFRFKNIALTILALSVFGVQVAAFSAPKTNIPLTTKPILETQNNNFKAEELKKIDELKKPVKLEESKSDTNPEKKNNDANVIDNTESQDLKSVTPSKEVEVKPTTRQNEIPNSPFATTRFLSQF